MEPIDLGLIEKFLLSNDVPKGAAFQTKQIQTELDKLTRILELAAKYDNEEQFAYHADLLRQIMEKSEKRKLGLKVNLGAIVYTASVLFGGCKSYMGQLEQSQQIEPYFFKLVENDYKSRDKRLFESLNYLFNRADMLSPTSRKISTLAVNVFKAADAYIASHRISMFCDRYELLGEYQADSENDGLIHTTAYVLPDMLCGHGLMGEDGYPNVLTCLYTIPFFDSLVKNEELSSPVDFIIWQHLQPRKNVSAGWEWECSKCPKAKDVISKFIEYSNKDHSKILRFLDFDQLESLARLTKDADTVSYLQNTRRDLQAKEFSRVLERIKIH